MAPALLCRLVIQRDCPQRLAWLVAFFVRDSSFRLRLRRDANAASVPASRISGMHAIREPTRNYNQAADSDDNARVAMPCSAGSGVTAGVH